MTQLQSDQSASNWRTRFLLMGAGLGAVVGLGTAYLLARTAEERGGGPPQISTGDAVKAAVGIVGVIRGIAALGDK